MSSNDRVFGAAVGTPTTALPAAASHPPYDIIERPSARMVSVERSGGADQGAVMCLNAFASGLGRAKPTAKASPNRAC
jgi:hypothetical protein